MTTALTAIPTSPPPTEPTARRRSLRVHRDGTHRVADARPRVATARRQLRVPVRRRAPQGCRHPRRSARARGRGLRLRLPRRSLHGDPPITHKVKNRGAQRAVQARARRGVRRGRVRQVHRQSRRVHRHVRPRRHQPRHRPRRRAPRQRPDGCHHRAGSPPHDRHRRLPGDAHGRDHPPDHQAQLPRHGRQRYPADRPRGVLPGVLRAPRPRVDRHPEGRPAADERPVLGAQGVPQRLPLAPSLAPVAPADGARAGHDQGIQAPCCVRRRRMPGRGARAEGVYRIHRDSSHQHPHGPRVLPRVR
mmetsp:Transcript_4178/g.18933  ORF Transcript_4178/g.18933 Transcript_4178/m.18933 type:complete len:304 (+) Transcript_4178:428-1339(+)